MFFAPVAKLVDALDLGSSVLRRVGSSPIGRTTKLPKCCSDESTTLRKFFLDCIDGSAEDVRNPIKSGRQLIGCHLVEC